MKICFICKLQKSFFWQKIQRLYYLISILALIARGVGQDTTKSLIMPQLVELSSDEISDVRLAAIETVVDLLTVSLLDDESRTQIIVPLVIKSCDQVCI